MSTVTVDRETYLYLIQMMLKARAIDGWVATAAQLGHSTPGSSLDYIHASEPGSPAAFVRDFVAWTSGRKDMAPGCEDRLREWGLEEARLRMEALLASELRCAS